MLPARFAPLLLRAELDGRPVGLALLVPNKVRRHGVFLARRLFLHSTGEPALDELTIEYNGILAETGREAEVARACLSRLLEERPEWDELVVDGATDRHMFEGLGEHGVSVMVARHSRCHGVDLASLVPGRYADSLEKQVRYTLRRSLRDFAVQGPVVLEEAKSLEEARDFLAGLKRLHQAYWQKRGMPGSFASSFFDGFQARLLDKGFALGAVQVLRLRAGETVLGYMYNLVHRGWVYQYVSGFDYALFPGRSPGSVGHALSIEHCAAKGYRVYDFMAGESQYKQRLARPLAELSWVVLRRDRLKFRLEDRLRAAWHRWKPSMPQPAPADPREGTPQ
jgi:CelD/BcsL family acetyltransferase involved in cellulose biosynthesis